jgi:nucleotide-binding universal stress UspA family protein
MIWDGFSPEGRWILDGEILDLSIVQRMPQDLPLQHHALSSSRVGGVISADNVDTKGPKTFGGIAEAWDSPSFVVDSESKAIKSLRKAVRWNAGNPRDRFLICETPDGFETFQDYAHNIADLFHAQMQRVDLFEDQDLCFRNLCEKASEGYGLLILGPQAKSCRKHPLAPLFQVKLAMELPISLLVVPKTRWPISRILVLIRGETHDDAAVEWGIRMAKASLAEIALLAVVPQVPVMYQGFDRISSGLPELLSTETKLGKHLRWAAGRLIEEGLNGTMQLRQGLQELQIRSEVMERDHDIVVVGAEEQDWLRRIMFRGHSYRFLHWLDRPMLISK